VFETVLTLQLQLQGLLSQRFAELFSAPANFASGMLLAVALGFVHALTPGHGKVVIFSHFLGQPGTFLAGLRVASLAALTHCTIAVLLVLATRRAISPLGRPTGAGGWIEVVAGAIVASMGVLYVVLALRGLKWRGTVAHRHGREQEGSHAPRSILAIAMGLLPCPLTIIVVGAAVARGETGAGIALAAGISIGAAITIASFGVLGMALRRVGVSAASGRVRWLMGALGWLELATATLILLIGVGMLAGSWGRIR
jgi:nickel/cobalt exporter